MTCLLSVEQCVHTKAELLKKDFAESYRTKSHADNPVSLSLEPLGFRIKHPVSCSDKQGTVIKRTDLRLD